MYCILKDNMNECLDFQLTEHNPPSHNCADIYLHITGFYDLNQ